MHINEFEDILNEFQLFFNCVKLSYRKIQDILFPLLKNRALFIETSSDLSKKLYHPIIEAFENVIENNKKTVKSRE